MAVSKLRGCHMENSSSDAVAKVLLQWFGKSLLSNFHDIEDVSVATQKNKDCSRIEITCTALELEATVSQMLNSCFQKSHSSYVTRNVKPLIPGFK